MLIIIGILLLVVAFLLFTRSIDVTYTSKKEYAEREELLVELRKDDSICLPRIDSTISNSIYSYRVTRNDVERKELYLKENSFSNTQILPYTASDFKDVIKNNGGLIVKIIERKEKENERKKENND